MVSLFLLQRSRKPQLEGREASRTASQALLTKQVSTCTVNLKIKEKSSKKKKD